MEKPGCKLVPMTLSAGVISTPNLGSVSDFVDGHSGVCYGGLTGIPVFEGPCSALVLLPSLPVQLPFPFPLPFPL